MEQLRWQNKCLGKKLKQIFSDRKYHFRLRTNKRKKEKKNRKKSSKVSVLKKIKKREDSIIKDRMNLFRLKKKQSKTK